MLKRINGQEDSSGARIPIKAACFPAPFKEGLEYSSPARGNWNIVHTGLLIPEAHEIFVCALGCLRGVVLTAAEAGALDRYSSVMIREENVLDGTMEELMIGGVSDILEKLPTKPKAILLFISCQHFFLAYDQKMVFKTLRDKYPDIHFADCYMIPTLRKSGLTPDQKMRIQLYSMLQPMQKKEKKINFIGSNFTFSESCEVLPYLKDNGYELQALNWCTTFQEYLDMAEAVTNIYYEPLAGKAAADLKNRLGQEELYLPFCFREKDLDDSYQKLAKKLNIKEPDFSAEKKKSEDALKKAKEIIGDTPIAVDYTFTFRILNYTRMLLEHGFHVTEIYADMLLPEEQQDFEWIRENYPEIMITATNRPKMRFLSREREEKTLAIGQKAAYFTGTDYFVNVAESGGLFGYDGIRQIAELMEDAFLQKKDRRSIIQKKGYGCESCIIESISL